MSELLPSNGCNADEPAATGVPIPTPPCDSSPPQVSDFARQHLRILGRESFEFRCFADSSSFKAKLSMQRFVGTFEEHKHRLRRLNDNGYGVFVQVNASDGVGHKDENIVSAPCIFADLDGAPRGNIDRLVLPPHLILETSRGKYHAYWQVQQMPLEQFTGVQRRIAQLLESDPAVCDKPRVMRLAGFLHQKNPVAAQLVKPIEIAEHPPVAFTDFMAALTEAETARGISPGKAQVGHQERVRKGDRPPIDKARLALQFLITKKLLDPSNYHDWMRIALALRTTYNEGGWELFHDLSCGSAGYVSEEDCRRQWNAGCEPKDRDPLTILSFLKEAHEAGWEPPTDQGHQGGKSPDQAIVVLRQAEEAGDEHFLSTDGRSHVRFRRSDDPASPRLTARLQSDLYKGVLRQRYFNEIRKKTLTADQLTSALALMDANAQEQGKRHAVYLRSAMFEGRLYIDLGRSDCAVVEVDEVGWRIIPEAPVRFLQGSRGALPDPESGGKIADFEQHMPSLSQQDVKRLVAFAIGVLYGGGTYPMLLFQGQQGAFKSTLADMLIALIDPPVSRKEARSSLASSEENVLIQGQNCLVLYLDNVSSFGVRESDLLCRLLSGGGISKRKLWSDDTEARIYLSRPVIATSIEQPSDRGDLLDRTLVLRTKRVNTRLQEEKVAAAFDQDRGKLFGVILDGLSSAIRNKVKIAERIASGELKLPRLADFAAVVEGAADVLELAPGEFSASLKTAQDQLQAESAASDPVGIALIRYFSRQGAKPIDASASELTELLQSFHDAYARDWPRPNKVKGHLTRIAPGLAQLGLALSFTDPQGKANVFRMQISATDAFQPRRNGHPPGSDF